MFPFSCLLSMFSLKINSPEIIGCELEIRCWETLAGSHMDAITVCVNRTLISTRTDTSAAFIPHTTNTHKYLCSPLYPFTAGQLSIAWESNSALHYNKLFFFQRHCYNERQNMDRSLRVRFCNSLPSGPACLLLPWLPKVLREFLTRSSSPCGFQLIL